METRILNYFLQIAKYGNMSKAAEEMHVTQPTLSRQIQNLEEQLGTKLFDRNNKKMTLTSAGVIFQQRAQEILTLLNKAEQDVQNENGLNGTIAIGCVESNVAEFLSKIIIAFHKKYPNIKFSIYDADGDDIKDKLDKGMIDLGFLLSPVEVAKYNYIDLPVKDSWAIIVPKGSPLANQDQISIDELKKIQLIIPAREIVQDEVVSWLHVPARDLNIVGSQNLIGNSLNLIKNGFGNILCTAGSFDLKENHDLKKIMINTDERIKHLLAWRKNYQMPTPAKTFIEFIKDYLKAS